MKAKLLRKTSRLTIRPLQLSDYAAWKVAYSTMQPPLNQWDRKNKPPAELTLPKFKTLLTSQKSNRSDDKFYDCAVFETATRKLIGVVSVMDVLRGVGHSAYLGYAIFNQYWGLGFGSEAVVAMIEIAFEDLDLHRLEAGIEPSNKKSLELARSIGLRKEGLKKRAVFLNGDWVDLVIYAVTSEDRGIEWRGKPAVRLR